MWSSGDSILLRYVRYGKVRLAEPYNFVEDAAGAVVLYGRAGAPVKVPVTDGRLVRGQGDQAWSMRDDRWRSHVLRITPWQERYSVILFWSPATTEFDGWYVNIQEPLRRSRFGFDTDDLVLDIRVAIDGSWRWKDEDELEQLVELGRFARTDADSIRAIGERVVAAPPWPTGWERWQPDPSWPVPELPQGWDVV